MLPYMRTTTTTKKTMTSSAEEKRKKKGRKGGEAPGATETEGKWEPDTTRTHMYHVRMAVTNFLISVSETTLYWLGLPNWLETT